MKERRWTGRRVPQVPTAVPSVTSSSAQGTEWSPPPEVRRKPRRARSALLVLVILSVVLGVTLAGIAVVTITRDPTTATSPSVRGTPAVTIDARSTDGDNVIAEIRIGSVVPSLSHSDTADCFGDARSVAIPISVTTTMKSSLSPDVIVDFNPTNSAGPDAFFYDTEDETCHSARGGWSLVFLRLQPKRASVGRGWIILSNVVSPNSPTGDPKLMGSFLVGVGVTVQSKPLRPYLFSGPNVIACSDRTSVGVARVWVAGDPSCPDIS